MNVIMFAVPVLIGLGLVGLAIYCLLTDKKRREREGEFYNHPDKNMPLYNKGHCDRYSAGNFYW